MVHQVTNLKICLSVFSWKENILDKVHIVHCIHVLLLLANLVLPFSFLKLLPTPSNVPSVVTAHNDETNCAAGMFFSMVFLAWVFQKSSSVCFVQMFASTWHIEFFHAANVAT